MRFVYLFRQGIFIDSASEEIEVKNLKHDLDYLCDLYENVNFSTVFYNSIFLDDEKGSAKEGVFLYN